MPNFISMSEGRKKIINLRAGIKNPLLARLFGLVEKPVESFFGLRRLDEAYRRLHAMDDGRNFFERAIDILGVKFEADPEDIAKIPTAGPLVVVSNHPLGCVDGIILGAVLTRVRKDAKMILNSMLSPMDEINECSISVNPFGGKKAAAQNVSAMKEIVRTLKNGGCVGTFPSGTVSYLRLRERCITDPEWNTNIFQMARRMGASILPVFFEARNSPLFYLAGVVHPRLRTALLIREMFAAASRGPVRMRVGSPIPPRKIAGFKTDEELAGWLRINSYILGGKNTKGTKASAQQISAFRKSMEKFFPKREMQELILPISPEKMEREIAALPESCKMVSVGKICVYCAEAWQIKWTLVEIGRLREKTFREVGEGTGKSIDNDEFDQYYLHMFMWDSENRRIAGAYRIGRTDKIINSIGVQGLYASTLFKIRPELMERIAPALEMGRSFIVSEYQKKRSTLAVLWRGIGEYLYRHPQYRTLYGPVSISTEYDSISKDLIVQFLSEKRTSEELAKFVKAKKPPKLRMKNVDRQTLMSCASDIEHISALVSEIEFDNKGIPTLLKHYLKLDGELLAFNVDREFGSCIDGLIMVDMLKTDPKLLKSYMGARQTVEYRKFHGLETEGVEIPKGEADEA